MRFSDALKLTAQGKKSIKCVNKGVNPPLRRWLCGKKWFSAIRALLCQYFQADSCSFISLISYRLAGTRQQHLSFWLSVWEMDGNITILSFTIFALLIMPVKSFAVTPVHCDHFLKPFNTDEWLSHLCFVTFVTFWGLTVPRSAETTKVLPYPQCRSESVYPVIALQ